MAKVITFSTTFPKSHPKAGAKTYFVEKIMSGLADSNEDWNMIDEFTEYDWYAYYNCTAPKFHTIRSGNRWKVGDMFSPRIWSGKPYNSKQIIFSRDLEIKAVHDIEIYPTNEVMIDGKFYCSFGSENWEALCSHDGLTPDDMRAWFSKLPFKGQIICWTDMISYS